MKKIFSFTMGIALLFIIIFPGNTHSENTSITSRGPAHPHYKMNLTYDTQRHELKGEMTVTFQQNLSIPLEELRFNVWTNATTFQEKGGQTQIHQVWVDGQKSSFRLQDTALIIPHLNLPSKTRHQVKLTFTVIVPQAEDRFGWSGSTVSLGNFFPILAIYDEEGWNTDRYFSHGESFYSLTSNFDVSLTTDSKQVIATTGVETKQPFALAGKTTHYYQAKQVRDFAIEMDPTYKIATTQSNGVKIHVYYKPEHTGYVDDMKQAAVDSMQLFTRKIGTYPWPELDVVTMTGWFGGMEYPQLVMISIRQNSSHDWIRTVVAHEVAHQWFYGILGNNEHDDPWLDEAFATYYESLYDNNRDQLTQEPVEDPSYHLSSPVSTFIKNGKENGDLYGLMIYDYGGRTLNDLRHYLGEDTFDQAIHAYYQKYRFGVVTTQSFIDQMEQTSGKDLSSFFQSHRVFANEE